MVHLRASANAKGVPLHWFRLAGLTHAGLLANTLKGLPRTEGFLKWAVDNLGGSYTWHTAVDLREEPRWEPDWITPSAIIKELIGRCANALWALPEGKRPEAWSALISQALGTVTPAQAAFFPGPLDGFVPEGVPQRPEAELKKARKLLGKHSSFKQIPGLMLVAYGGGIDASMTKDILRLLEGSGEQLSKRRTAHPILRCCAYIAATTRDTELANATIMRCLRLVTSEMPVNQVLALMLTAIRAGAAFGKTTTYYVECGKVASRFAYAVSAGAALDVRATLEELCHRDPKFIAALGHAMAVVEATALELVSSPVDPISFRLLMERVDNALQNCGMILPGGGAAMADWKQFAAKLGEQFFAEMKAVPITETLITQPPGKRLNVNGSAQWGGPVDPIASVEHLFTRGVCQVRHNIVHGNKQDIGERDMKLIGGAHYILRAAIAEADLFEL
jgi:hypothetical protein